ncbi:MAG: zinc-ribbon and FHA domain-containing protein [Candidatus Eisenbacteria sp.]|nr:zinc-ribbon and FHA domain-containing protein [Candidatus Eisenbacteria bacterium]
MTRECACCGSQVRPGNHFCTHCGIAWGQGKAPRAAVVLLHGRREWGRRAITNRAVQIGSGKFCEIVFNDPLVSERHARIVYSDGSFWIEDLASRNGTFVNGGRIDRRNVLRDGYLVRVGSSMLRFEQHPAERISIT